MADVSQGKAVGITAGCTKPYTGATSGSGSVCGFNYAPLFESHIGDLRNIAYARLPHNNEIAYGVNDEFNWKIDDHLTLKSITAGRTDNSSQEQGNATEVLTTISGPQLFYEYQLSQEFNLIHQYGPMSGVVGAFYYLDNNHYLANGYNPGGNVKIPNPDGRLCNRSGHLGPHHVPGDLRRGELPRHADAQGHRRRALHRGFQDLQEL